MKVIKHGNLNYNKPWAGLEVSCERCKCVFILDENDKPKFNSDQREGDYYEIACPTCKGSVTFSRTTCRPVERKPDVIHYDSSMDPKANLGMEQCPHCKRYGLKTNSMYNPDGKNLVCFYCKGTVCACPDCGGNGKGR